MKSLRTPSVLLKIRKTTALALLVPILLVAVFLRFWDLAETPPGFHFDLAFNAFDIARLQLGDWRIFFPANTGREPLFIYLQAGMAALFGLAPFALRLTSAIVGVATIPLIYRLGTDLFRSRVVGVLAAAFAAISFWHIFYSRMGLRGILVVPLTLLVFWFLWRAITRLRWQDYALAGMALALALYTYPSARLLPLAILVIVGWTTLNERAQWKFHFNGTVILLAVCAIMTAPLAAFFATHPDELLSHTLQVSVLAPTAEHPDVGGAILANTLRVLGMFFVVGDQGLVRNLPGRPIFDPIVGTLFLVGVGFTLFSVCRPRLAFRDRLPAIVLTVWLATAMLTSILSDDAPNFLRTLPAFPAVMVLPAWGAAELWQRIYTPTWRKAFGAGLLGTLLLGTGMVYRDYFDAYAHSPALYGLYDVDKVEIADWINATAEKSQIYLAPLYAQQGTIGFLTRATLLKSFDSRDTIILPAREHGRDADYVYPPEQVRRIETLAARLGIGARADVIGPNDTPILLVYHVPNAQLPSAAAPLENPAFASQFTRAMLEGGGSFAGKIRVLGANVLPQNRTGEQLNVTVLMQAAVPIASEFTFSVKVRDTNGSVVGQEDKMPGSNSFPTTHWAQHEIVIERFYPEFEGCLAQGNYAITLEVYEPETGDVLQVDGMQGNVLELGTVRANDDCTWNLLTENENQ